MAADLSVRVYLINCSRRHSRPMLWTYAPIARQRYSRLREVVGDEVGALEEQEYVAEALTLQGAVQGNPVCVLRGERHAHTHRQSAPRHSFKQIEIFYL